MKFCFVTGETLNAFWDKKLEEADKPNVLVFGFGGLGLVSYKKEIEGETEYFQDVARLSKTLGSVVISGCDTDTYGVYRHSAVIADRGKLLGVSDSSFTVDDGEFSSGGNFRVYETSVGRIGLIVGEDLYFSEVPKTLALCDSDVLVCVFKRVENSIPEVMMRAGAFSNGVPIVMVAEGLAEISDIKGEIVFSGRKNVCAYDLKIEKDYHVVTSRRRGIYKKFKFNV